MKRFLLFLTLLFPTCLYSLGATVGDKYDLVTTTSGITSGGEYILVYVPDSGNPIAMGGMGSNKYFSPVNGGVTISNQIATIADTKVQTFSIIENGSNNYNILVDGKYLKFTGSNASMSLETSNTDAATKFKISFTSNKAYISTYISSSSADFYLQYNKASNGLRFGNYKGTQEYCYLYKKQTSTPPTPTKPTYLTFTPENGSSISTTDQISLESDGTTINYSIDTQDYSKTYSTPFTLSAGEHTVYAKASNLGGDFTASATYTVTAPEKERVEYTGLNKYNLTEDITFELGKNYQLELGDKHPVISFECEPDDVISIDADGEITATQTGEVYVSATWAENDYFFASTEEIMFTVTVTEPQGGEGPQYSSGDATYIFTGDGAKTYGMTMQSGNSSTYNPDPYIIDDEEYPLLITLNGNQRLWSDGLRFHKDSSFNVSFREGVSGTITKIVIGGSNASSFKVGTNQSGTYSGGTWTGSDSSVDISTDIASGGKAISTLTISYTIGTTEPEEPELGEITVTVSDGQTLANEGNITVALGTTFTFTAENAEEFLLLSDSFKADATESTLEWTPDQTCTNEEITVNATTAKDTTGKEFKFTLTVIDPNEGGENPEPSDATYIFTGDDAKTYGMTMQSGNSSTYNPDPYIIDDEEYPLLITLNGNQRLWSDGLRFHKDSSFNVSFREGVTGTITKIVIGGSNASSFKVGTNQSGTYSGGTWTGSDSSVDISTDIASGGKPITTLTISYTLVTHNETHIIVPVPANHKLYYKFGIWCGNGFKDYAQYRTLSTPEGFVESTNADEHITITPSADGSSFHKFGIDGFIVEATRGSKQNLEELDNNEVLHMSIITEDGNGNQSGVQYYGVAKDPEVAGVGSVEADGSDESNAVYYNLQGVRMGKDSLTPGVYVRVAGGTATKVHVRQ